MPAKLAPVMVAPTSLRRATGRAAPLTSPKSTVPRWPPSLLYWRASYRAGSASEPKSSRSILSAPTDGSEVSRSTGTTAVGRISPPATRAAIRFRLSPISLTCRRARRRACSPVCWASKPGDRVMDDRPDFSPLSDAEREAAQELAADGEPHAAKPTCPPADAEPPEAAATRLFGPAPDKIWRYVDPGAALAFCVCRWDFGEGRKEIRPLSWFEGEGWRFRHWRDVRPLYNRDRVAAHPDTPIVVCEGEKAADAAACIFPKSIATTSCGGANAATKSDWAPLGGRRVLNLAGR